VTTGQHPASAPSTCQRDLAELLAEQDKRVRMRQASNHLDGEGIYGLRSQPTAELERIKRDLRASLGLIVSNSPAHVPIQSQMRAIDSELARRAASQGGGAPS
jgi:hypothetical protein